METFSTLMVVVLGIYIPYYGINIVYDLYIKKGSVTPIEEEEYLMEQYSNESIKKVTIEDVETINMPNSFVQQETDIFYSEQELRPSLDELKIRFEREQEEDTSVEFAEKIIISEKNKFKKLLSLAESSVQMVANYDGQKVYQSII